MMWLVKWLSVPVLVLLVATCLALADLFEAGWVIALFAVLAFIVFFFWRRAAFRLVPWLTQPPRKDMDPVLKKKVGAIFMRMLFGSLIVMVLALIIMVFWIFFFPQSLSPSTFILVCTIWFVALFSKYAIMTILIRRMLDHEAANAGVLPSVP